MVCDVIKNASTWKICLSLGVDYLDIMKQKLHMAKNKTVWSMLCTYQSTFTSTILNDVDECNRYVYQSFNCYIANT